MGTLHQLPHLLRWYGNVQAVPGVLRAAKDCGMALSIPLAPMFSFPKMSEEDNTAIPLEQKEGQEMTTQPTFVGGPRPTMTKLKVKYFFVLLYNYITLYTSLQTHLL